MAGNGAEPTILLAGWALLLDIRFYRERPAAAEHRLASGRSQDLVADRWNSRASSADQGGAFEVDDYGSALTRRGSRAAGPSKFLLPWPSACGSRPGAPTAGWVSNLPG